MRFRDTGTHEVANSICRVDQIRMKDVTLEVNKRDIWVRLIRNHAIAGNGALPHCYVFRTRTAANQTITQATLESWLADDVVKLAAGVIMKSEQIAPGDALQTLTPTLLTGALPDMGGLTLGVYVYEASPSTWTGVWGYTSELSNLVGSQIESILDEYVSEGQALADFAVGSISRGPRGKRARRRQVLTVQAGDEQMPAEVGGFARDVSFSIEVGHIAAAKDGVTAADGRKGVGAIESCKAAADAVVSIIGDERRTLGGLCIKAEILDVSEPAIAETESSGSWAVCEITGRALFRGNLYADK